jgi:hypothetical protein
VEPRLGIEATSVASVTQGFQRPVQITDFRFQWSVIGRMQ